jgi:predicted Zn-dependent protease with MMP-like domain
VLARESVPDTLQQQYKGCLLFGIFSGIACTQRSMFNVPMEPTCIELYKGSIEAAAGSREVIE